MPGPLHGRRLLVKDLIDTAGIRTTYGSQVYADHVPDANRDRGRAARQRGRGRRRQGEPARVRVGRDEPEPVVRNGAEPAPPRQDDRRLVRRQRRRARRRDVRHRDRHRHRLLDPPPGIVLRGRRPEAELGPDPRRRRVPALPVVRHRWADGDDRRGGRDDVVGARRGAAAGAPPSRARWSGCSRRPPSVGGPALPENRAAEAYVDQLEALGARVVEASIPEPPDDTWPLFFHEAAHAHRSTFPARAGEYGENVRAKLELAQDVDPAEVDRARASVRAWRGLRAGRRPLRRTGARGRAAAGRL